MTDINEKLTNFFNKCFENNQYLIKEINSKFYFDYSKHLLIKVKYEGSSGANGFGDRGSSFRVDHSERNSIILEELMYVIKPLVKNEKDPHFLSQIQLICECDLYSPVTEMSDYDYYGNGYSYEILPISYSSILDAVIDKETKIPYEPILDSISKQFKEQIDFENNTKQLEIITKQLNTFESDSLAKKNNLEKNIENIKKTLLILEEQLNTFNTTQEKELTKLIKEKKKLEKELSTNNSTLKKAHL